MRGRRCAPSHPPRCSYTSEMVERGGYTSLDLLDGDCVMRPESLGGRFARTPGSPGPQVAPLAPRPPTRLTVCLLGLENISSSGHVLPLGRPRSRPSMQGHISPRHLRTRYSHPAVVTPAIVTPISHYSCQIDRSSVLMSGDQCLSLLVDQ